MRQQEITLSVVNNIVRVTLQFKCTRMIMLNNTSNDVYVNYSSFLPTAVSRNYIIKAAVSGFPGNVSIPQNSYEYCFYLPLTPTLTDTNMICTVLLQGEDVKAAHYREVLLNALTSKKN